MTYLFYFVVTINPHFCNLSFSEFYAKANGVRNQTNLLLLLVKH